MLTDNQFAGCSVEVVREEVFYPVKTGFNWVDFAVIRCTPSCHRQTAIIVCYLLGGLPLPIGRSQIIYDKPFYFVIDYTLISPH